MTLPYVPPNLCVVLWWLGRLCVYDGLYDEIETIKIPEEHLVLPGSGAVLRATECY